jgi:hypothetical protein
MYSSAADARVAGRDLGRAQRLATVVSVYHAATAGQRGPLVLGWVRTRTGGQVNVVTGGTSGRQRQPDGLVPIDFWPGAWGVPLGADEQESLFAPFRHWSRVVGVPDSLVLPESAVNSPTEHRPSMEDCLLAAWPDPFVWLLVARPLRRQSIEAEIDSVADEERDALRRTSSPEFRLRAAALGHRHRELRAALSTGAWEISLLVGGTDPAASFAVAGLVCASADLTSLPYALIPSPEDADRPFVAGSALVAAIARPPTIEVPGFRIRPRSTFDVAIDQPVGGGARSETLDIGDVLDRDGVVGEPLPVRLASLNRHTFVCGATGSGKTQTIKHMLGGLADQGVPWMVVEPTKAEYRRLAGLDWAGDPTVIRVGDLHSPPVSLNPLEPASGYPLQAHADLVRSLFVASFAAEEPFPQVLASALTRCYEELGWDLAMSEPRSPGVRPRYPTLTDLQRAAELVVDEVGYGGEITSNVRGFVAVRLASLRRGTPGRFFEHGHPLDFAAVLRTNVIFEIEDVTDDHDKAFLIGVLLIRLFEELRVTAVHGDGSLRHVTVFEEAHRLLRNPPSGGTAFSSVELFAGLLAEIRAYGEGLIVAEQIPSKIIPDVIKNSAVKIIHRLPAMDDRYAVGATANISTDQSQHLVSLRPGVAAVHTDGMDQAVLVQVPYLLDWAHRHDGPLRGPDHVIGRRSATCGTECSSQACTLREMTSAYRLIDAEPWLSMWAELAVLGHLIAFPAPALTVEHLAGLRDLPPRVRECALSQAVDEAVAARSATFDYSPDHLARHVLDELNAQADRAETCPDAERFLARRFRWVPLRNRLTDAQQGGQSERHPDTDRLQQTFGRVIPGETLEDQITTVTDWLRADLQDSTAIRAVLLGDRTPSRLEKAIGARTGTPAWTDATRAVIGSHLAHADWALSNLATFAAEEAPHTAPAPEE